MSLYDETIGLLKGCPREVSLAHIARETGLGEAWLSDILRDPDRDPGVKKIQKLHDYLVTLPKG